MKSLYIFLFILIFGIPVIGQRLTSVVEGLLEVYDPEDTTSLYIGKGNGKHVNAPYLYNTFVGTNAGLRVQNGLRNSIFGYKAGENITIGTNNNYFGYRAGRLSREEDENCFFGNNSGALFTKGFYNNFFGNQSGEKLDTSSYNSFYGHGTGSDMTSGSANCLIGFASGFMLKKGSGNIFIGSQSGPAGFQVEISNRLFIDNTNTNTPLIYEEFDNDQIQLNGTLTMGNTSH